MTLTRILKFFTATLLFLLPWHTVWIYRELAIEGFIWQYGTLGFYATELLLWGSVVLFVWWYWREYQQKKISKEPFYWSRDRRFLLLVLLLVMYTFLSATWALDWRVVWQQGLRLLEVVFFTLILFLGPLKKDKIMWYFVLGSIVPSILGVAQFFLQQTWASTLLGLAAHPAFEIGSVVIGADGVGRWIRAYGSFAHPNIFGGYLVLVLFGTMWFWQKQDRTRWQTFGLGLVTGLEMLALMVSFSRSAWIAAAVLVTGFAFFAIRNKLRQVVLFFPIIFSLILFAVVLVPGLFSHRLGVPEIPSRYEVRSIEERQSQVGEAFELFIHHPWRGAGAGNYTFALYRELPLKSLWLYQPIHVVPLLFLVEWGIVGVVLLLLVCFFAFLLTRPRVYSSISVAVLVAYILLLCFDHYLLSFYPAILFHPLFWYFFFLYTSHTHTSSE